MRAGPVALVALLVLAGCGGLIDPTPTGTPAGETPTATPTEVPTASPNDTASPDGTETPTGTPTETTTSTPTPESTLTPTPVGTDTPALSADNPWGQRIVHVSVNDTVEDGRNATAIVERSIDYWNAKMSRYTDYDFRFRLAEDPSDARVDVRFVEGVTECDAPPNHAAGCARYIQSHEQARDTEPAWVVSNGSNAAVTGTTKHELGHLLGLDHEDEPQFLMAQGGEAPVRDAPDRVNPWHADTLAVAVEHDTFDADEGTIDEQVDDAVRYYDDGAGGTVPENVTVERTDVHHAAEVLVTNDRETCSVDGGSQIRLFGQNLDQDGAMEVYDRAVVCVDVDDEAVGWHVGYSLGGAFGLSSDELAEPFRDADYDDRRGEWWE